MKIKILDKIPDCLRFQPSHLDLIAPSYEELSQLALVDGVALRVVTVYENDEILACAPCYCEHRRHHGLRLKIYSLFGGMLHDYLYIFMRNPSVAKPLLNAICADALEQKCDLISIDNVIGIDNGLASFSRTVKKKIFDSRIANGGWSELYNRKSVKRFVQAARKVGAYHIVVTEGLVSRLEMEGLKALHIQRWTFADSVSAFSLCKHRIEEYITYPENKCYLRVMLGDEIMACHYGMRYGKSLLWHTPIINPKYLSLSPLRILLAETARWCEGKGLQLLDFGLGDEKYKDGYCSTDRVTFSFCRDLSIRSRVATVIGILFSSNGLKFLKMAHYIACKVWTKFRASCERWHYYVGERSDLSDEDSRFVKVDTWYEFCDLMVRTHEPIYQWHYDRFHHDESLSFVALVENDNLMSWGWQTYRNRALLNGHEREGVRILYDFVTAEKYRNRGCYTRLLQCLLCLDSALIYVNPRNTLSRRAIERVGFKRYA